MKHYESIPQVCPLSRVQTGIYLECIDDPGTKKYNIPIVCRLPDGVDMQRFAGAVRKVVSAHRVFGVTVGAPDGVPSMIYREGSGIALEEKKVDSLADEEAVFCRPFDLERGPLCRFELVSSPQGNALLADVHHLIFDGTSVNIFSVR